MAPEEPVRPRDDVLRRHERPLRIGILIALLPPDGVGGAEFQAARLARELAARGHEVHVFSRGRGWRGTTTTEAGVHLHRRAVLPLRGARLFFEVLAGGWQAGRAHLDVMLCYMTLNSGLVGYAAHRFGSVPFVIWQRVEAEARLRPSTWSTRLSAWVSHRAAEIWVQSERIRQLLQQEYVGAGKPEAWRQLEPRLRVMGNGVDLCHDPDDLPPRRFLFAGRLVEQKNPLLLVEASRNLADAEVWIAGAGPLAATLERAAAGAPVRFLGVQPRERIQGLLRQSRALVLCSHYEGLPNIVLEALACGRPVIATPVGAVPELIRDGVNGCLVPVGDAAALRHAMESLLDDALWSRLARAARPTVAPFGWPALVERVESALQDVALRRAGRP